MPKIGKMTYAEYIGILDARRALLSGSPCTGHHAKSLEAYFKAFWYYFEQAGAFGSNS